MSSYKHPTSSGSDLITTRTNKVAQEYRRRKLYTKCMVAKNSLHIFGSPKCWDCFCHAIRWSCIHMIPFHNLIGDARFQVPEVNGLNRPVLPGSFLPHAVKRKWAWVQSCKNVFTEFLSRYMQNGLINHWPRHLLKHRVNMDRQSQLFPFQCTLTVFLILRSWFRITACY